MSITLGDFVKWEERKKKQQAPSELNSTKTNFSNQPSSTSLGDYPPLKSSTSTLKSPFSSAHLEETQRKISKYTPLIITSKSTSPSYKYDIKKIHLANNRTDVYFLLDSANDYLQVCTIIENYYQKFDEVDLVNAFIRLTRFYNPNFNPKLPPLKEKINQILLDTLVNLQDYLTPHYIFIILHTIKFSSLPVKQELFFVLTTCAQKRINEFKTDEIPSFLKNLSFLKYENPLLVEQLAELIKERKNELSGMQVYYIFMSLIKLEHKDNDLYDFLEKRLIAGIDDFSPQEFTNITHCFAKADCKQPPQIRSLAKKLLTIPFNVFEKKQFANFLWEFSKLGHINDELHKRLLNEVRSHLKILPFDNLEHVFDVVCHDTREWSTENQILAKEIFDIALKMLSERLDSLNAHSLTLFTSRISLAGCSKKELYESIARRAIQIVKKFNQNDSVSLLFAFIKANMHNRKLFSAFSDHVCQLLSKSHNSIHITKVIKAYAQMHSTDKKVLITLGKQFLANINTFSTISVTSISNSYASIQTGDKELLTLKASIESVTKKQLNCIAMPKEPLTYSQKPSILPTDKSRSIMQDAGILDARSLPSNFLKKYPLPAWEEEQWFAYFSTWLELIEAERDGQTAEIYLIDMLMSLSGKIPKSLLSGKDPKKTENGISTVGGIIDGIHRKNNFAYYKMVIAEAFRIAKLENAALIDHLDPEEVVTAELIADYDSATPCDHDLRVTVLTADREQTLKISDIITNHVHKGRKDYSIVKRDDINPFTPKYGSPDPQGNAMILHSIEGKGKKIDIAVISQFKNRKYLFKCLQLPLDETLKAMKDFYQKHIAHLTGAQKKNTELVRALFKDHFPFGKAPKIIPQAIDGGNPWSILSQLTKKEFVDRTNTVNRYGWPAYLVSRVKGSTDGNSNTVHELFGNVLEELKTLKDAALVEEIARLLTLSLKHLPAHPAAAFCLSYWGCLCVLNHEKTKHLTDQVWGIMLPTFSALFKQNTLPVLSSINNCIDAKCSFELMNAYFQAQLFIYTALEDNETPLRDLQVVLTTDVNDACAYQVRIRAGNFISRLTLPIEITAAVCTLEKSTDTDFSFTSAPYIPLIVPKKSSQIALFFNKHSVPLLLIRTKVHGFLKRQSQYMALFKLGYALEAVCDFLREDNKLINYDLLRFFAQFVNRFEENPKKALLRILSHLFRQPGKWEMFTTDPKGENINRKMIHLATNSPIVLFNAEFFIDLIKENKLIFNKTDWQFCIIEFIRALCSTRWDLSYELYEYVRVKNPAGKYVLECGFILLDAASRKLTSTNNSEKIWRKLCEELTQQIFEKKPSPNSVSRFVTWSIAFFSIGEEKENMQMRDHFFCQCLAQHKQGIVNSYDSQSASIPYVEFIEMLTTLRHFALCSPVILELTNKILEGTAESKDIVSLSGLREKQPFKNSQDFQALFIKACLRLKLFNLIPVGVMQKPTKEISTLISDSAITLFEAAKTERSADENIDFLLTASAELPEDILKEQLSLLLNHFIKNKDLIKGAKILLHLPPNLFSKSKIEKSVRALLNECISKDVRYFEELDEASESLILNLLKFSQNCHASVWKFYFNKISTEKAKVQLWRALQKAEASGVFDSQTSLVKLDRQRCWELSVPFCDDISAFEEFLKQDSSFYRCFPAVNENIHVSTKLYYEAGMQCMRLMNDQGVFSLDLARKLIYLRDCLHFQLQAKKNACKVVSLFYFNKQSTPASIEEFNSIKQKCCDFDACLLPTLERVSDPSLRLIMVTLCLDQYMILSADKPNVMSEKLFHCIKNLIKNAANLTKADYQKVSLNIKEIIQECHAYVFSQDQKIDLAIHWMELRKNRPQILLDIVVMVNKFFEEKTGRDIHQQPVREIIFSLGNSTGADAEILQDYRFYQCLNRSLGYLTVKERDEMAAKHKNRIWLGSYSIEVQAIRDYLAWLNPFKNINNT